MLKVTPSVNDNMFFIIITAISVGILFVIGPSFLPSSSFSSYHLLLLIFIIIIISLILLLLFSY